MDPRDPLDDLDPGLRREVAPHGVRVHAVNPGFVATEFLARALGRSPAEGDPDGGIPPGTAFEDIPGTWMCPVCGARKRDFVPYEG